ncbi:MAG TPA: alkaline phosphatase family protein, partial [Gemmatimonadales bacterium]|nr:alkaline phosphatase family protein [Gemmatimonadales bacterium]
QTPVAWSTFATGANPGVHGIFDFLRRDPATCLPDLSLNRYEQKNAFVPPKAVNLRRGTPLWELLAKAGVPSAIIRCPCTYPPDEVKGRLLGGMGVPDLRGGLGTPTYFTTNAATVVGESERVTPVVLKDGRIRTELVGPRLPRGGDATIDLAVEVHAGGTRATLRVSGHSSELQRGEWGPWLKVKFKLGLLQAVAGQVRFFLPEVHGGFALYASPVNFTPDAPPFPISAPWDYAGELEHRIGSYYTAGMPEDHTGLVNGRIDEAAFLAQCDLVMREREAMLDLELARLDRGLLFCLFDTPDRLQHLFWRFLEPDHPANVAGFDPAYRHTIAEHYRRLDGIVGRVAAEAGPETLVIVLSDHGFTSFRRGVHLNGWLLQHGYLALKRGTDPGESGEFFRAVDWDRTSAYALGLGGIYLNRRGREAHGIVAPEDAGAVAEAIQAGMRGLPDPTTGVAAVRAVKRREEIYHGAAVAEAPDLLALFERGYRASWTTALGGIGAGIFEDNTRRWGGDHIVDPVLVPGVLFMSRPFPAPAPRMVDLAPTILNALGVPAGPDMEGESLLG